MTLEPRTLISIAATAAIVAAWRLWLHAPAGQFYRRHQRRIDWMIRPAHMWTIVVLNAAALTWLLVG